MTGFLLTHTALAAAPPCDALLADPPRIREAVAAVAAGADPNARCDRHYAVRVRPHRSFAEVLLGVIIPPIGIAMAMEPGHDEARVAHPALLDLAVQRRAGELVDALLVAGADPLAPAPGDEARPLEVAVAEDLSLGGAVWTTRLLSHGAWVPPDLLAERPDSLDRLLAHPEVLDALVRHGLDDQGRDHGGGTWLSRAIAHGHDAELRAALARGADPNLRVRGTPPFALAVAQGSLSAMQILVDAGADPVQPGPVGESLLTAAVRSGAGDVVSAVLALGVPVQADDDYDQPMDEAVRSRNPDIIRLLGDRGAVPGRDAVLAAVLYEDAALLDLVLAYGGDPDVPDLLDRTPLSVALELGRADLVERLLAAGADPDAAALPLDPLLSDPALRHLLLPHLHRRGPLLRRALASGDEAVADEVARGADLAPLLVESYGHPEVQAWLRARGARYPADALAEVVALGTPDDVALALADGARVVVPSPVYGDAASIAVRARDRAVVELLAAHGARLPEGRWVEDALWDHDLERLALVVALGAPVTEDDLDAAADRCDPAEIALLASAPGPRWRGWHVRSCPAARLIAQRQRAEARTARRAQRRAQ
ncbi:MAG: hypothetical protein R3F59_07855 [Myxococcota bacterium]